jgi:hypothetical protein
LASAGQAGGAGYNATILTPPVKNWRCPNCGREKQTQRAGPHTPLHQCPRLRGAWAPFVEAHVNARLELVERGDYVNGDLVQVDGEGRPVMSVVTHRDNGQDCTIFAPCATANGVNKEGADRGLD